MEVDGFKLGEAILFYPSQLYFMRWAIGLVIVCVYKYILECSLGGGMGSHVT